MIQTHSLADAATVLGCSPDWLRRRAKRGEFAWTEGSNRSVRFTDAQLEALVASRQRGTGAPGPSDLAQRGRRRSA